MLIEFLFNLILNNNFYRFIKYKMNYKFNALYFLNDFIIFFFYKWKINKQKLYIIMLYKQFIIYILFNFFLALNKFIIKYLTAFFKI